MDIKKTYYLSLQKTYVTLSVLLSLDPAWRPEYNERSKEYIFSWQTFSWRQSSAVLDLQHDLTKSDPADQSFFWRRQKGESSMGRKTKEAC
jgi:hypothetical protein